MSMRVSPAGVDFIKRWEGLETRSYRDIANVWTIGYGHTGPDVRPGATIAETEAAALLQRDLVSREESVARLVDVPLNQNEFDALVSFEFNTGGLARSTALKRLNEGDRLGAAEAFAWWNKARIDGALQEVEGLTRRRAAEAVLFLTPVRPA